MKPEGAGRLTLGAYRDLGGLHGAISRRVDLLLEEFREAEDAVPSGQSTESAMSLARCAHWIPQVE